MKHHRLLMGLVVGLLYFGCDATLSVAFAGSVNLPNFVKHNQGTGATPTPSPTASPTSAKAATDQVATITATLDDSGYIKYTIVDKSNVTGKQHDRTHVSSENHSSTLFKTAFDPNIGLTVTTLDDGEVQISGYDPVTKETLTWVSCQNNNKDDDVTWTQTQ